MHHSKNVYPVVAIAFALLLSVGSSALATDYTVTDSTSFYNAIQSMGAAPTSSDRIIIANSFTMGQQVLAITTTGSLTIVGGNNTIDGNGAYRPFFIESGNVTVQNLTISDAVAHGGNASSEGGGGLGAGGAIFLESSAHLTIQNVNFTGNAAIGGSGYTTMGAGPGGGGGLGGDGNTGNGGGGGLYGQGAAGDQSFGGGGGGGGELGNGGSGSFGGGGGGGSINNGSAGSFPTGGTGGTIGGGDGGSYSNGQDGTAGGGGGGGSQSGNAGNGDLFGGGGGAGSMSRAGNGGDFGGGGGSNDGTGAGNGGFGGGGGGAYNTSAGNGGFGAGGGGTAGGGSTVYGVGGFGGGNGTTTGNGGGGAGFGGAIFAREGATITIVDSTTFSGNQVVGGPSGGTGAGNGSTDGTDLYLMRGTTTSFNVSSGQTMTFSTVLGNNDGTAQPGAAIVKVGDGTLVLTGNSTYSGTTYVQAGTLQANGSLGGFITVSASSTLSGTSATLNQTITSSGHVLLTETGASTYAINDVHGAGDFTKDGAGTLSLSGTAFYTGGTNVAAGTLIGDTTSLKRTFTDSGNITFNQSSDGTFAGNIAGTGSVTLAGTGNVFFTGTNSYSGGTNINSGTLTLLNSGSFSGLDGSGALDFSAPGTSTISGNNTFSGGTSVNAGTVVVDGTLGGSMTVNSGGTLMGVGTVGDTTINTGGTIYPGIVGAPLTVNGSFTQNTGTTYSAEVNPTASDKIIVNGHATIQTGTTFNIVLDPGSYTAGTHYVVLTASGGISGTYSTTVMPSPGSGLVFELEYDPFDIQLIIESLDPPGTHFASFAQTFNQFNVGTALDTISPTATGSMSSLITELEALSPSQLQGALNQLAGDIYPSISSIELQTSTTWLQLISNRLASKIRMPQTGAGSIALNDLPPSDNPDADIYTVSFQQPTSPLGRAASTMTFRRANRPQWSGWTQGYGLGGSLGSNGNASAANYGLGGTIFGIDRWIGPRTIVGILGGYAGSNVGQSSVAANSRINGYQVGLYEMHCRDVLYFSNIDAFSNDTYDTTRQVAVAGASARSSTYGNQWAHYSEMGATFTGETLRLQPFGGIQYIYLDQRAFGETGAGAANLNVGNQITNSVRGSAGARLSWLSSIGNVRIIPVAHARYQREWGDGTRLVTSSFSGAPTVAFNVAGNNLGRDFGLFGLGASAILSPRTSLYGGYDLQVASRYAANMGSAGFQFRW